MDRDGIQVLKHPPAKKSESNIQPAQVIDLGSYCSLAELAM